MNIFTARMIRAAKLDVNLYEEVEADRGATGQAMWVVILAALGAGLATMEARGFAGLIWGLIAALAAWFIWAYLNYLIGTKLIPEPQTEADVGQLLRTLGFASSPGIIRVIGIIPVLRGLVFFVASIWMLVAMVIAVRQALDYRSTWRAIGVCIIGWIVYAAVGALLLSLVGRA